MPTKRISEVFIFLVLINIVAGNQPNIVLIIADDMGWSDIGFTDKHGASTADVPESPNLDGLAADGVILDNFYVQALCSPTRASLMTGKYPHKIGQAVAYAVFGPFDNLGTEHRLFSEDLSEKNYDVQGVGKWHLGRAEKALPTSRGFNSFYGAYSGMINHYTHKSPMISFTKNGSFIKGYRWPDFHYDHTDEDGDFVSEDICAEVDGIHSTDLFTAAAVDRIKEHDQSNPLFLYVAYTTPHSELQPDPEIVKTRNQHIKDEKKREYAAMVTQMDNGVGEIVSALKDTDMWENTVFVFMSDHGASRIRNCWDTVGGSNAPYRDGKSTMFEGALKSAAFVWSPWLQDDIRGSHSKALLHIVDLYPLFMDLADGMINDPVKDAKCTTKECDKRDGGHYFRNVLNGINVGRDTIVHNMVKKVPDGKTLYYCSKLAPEKKTFPKLEVTLPDDYAVVRHHQYKLLEGLGDWCKNSRLVEKPCPEQFMYKNTSVMLFDIEKDPYETQNVASDHLDIVEKLHNIIVENQKDAVDYWTTGRVIPWY